MTTNYSIKKVPVSGCKVTLWLQAQTNLKMDIIEREQQSLEQSLEILPDCSYYGEDIFSN